MANLPYRILLQKNEYRVENPHQQFPFFSLFAENCQLCIHSDFDDDENVMSSQVMMSFSIALKSVT